MKENRHDKWYNKRSSEGLNSVASFVVREIPEIKTGDDIGEVIFKKMKLMSGIKEKDIFVIASKIVSKSEGRRVDLSTIVPSEEAIKLYELFKKKSPQIYQVILNESISYKIGNSVVVARHKLGMDLTSAGVDREREDQVIILPENPDHSAKRIADKISALSGKQVAVIISDSEGRSDRKGAGAVSIGVAGINPLRVNEDTDPFGKSRRTEETISDLLAAQGSLLMGQRGNNTPVVCIRNFQFMFDPNAKLSDILHDHS